MWMNNYTKQNKPEKGKYCMVSLICEIQKNEIKIARTEMVVACA